MFDFIAESFLTLSQTHLDEFPTEPIHMVDIALRLMDDIVQVLIGEVSPAMTGKQLARL